MNTSLQNIILFSSGDVEMLNGVKGNDTKSKSNDTMYKGNVTMFKGNDTKPKGNVAKTKGNDTMLFCLVNLKLNFFKKLSFYSIFNNYKL